ncbi:MAG: carotenoid oxygenase family protein [Caulobacteraceae bacterium]|nr:carotenoid oxygenase family protein [Caulobacteraceae bacterium]
MLSLGALESPFARKTARSSGGTLGNPYLEGNFAPVEVETTAFNLPIRGRIPEDLAGRLVRIGPNPLGPVNPKTHHWFMGAGMAHGLRLRDGRAEWYRNRFIGSDNVARSLGRPRLAGPRNGFSDTVNTNIVQMGGRDYAVVEAGGLPVELTYELESVARSDLGGTLKHGFSAHPKRDPATGEQHVVTYQPGLKAVSCLSVDAAGRARTVAEIPASHGPMIHDTAFTASWIVVLDLPVTFKLSLLGRGFPFAWNPRQAPRVGLLPRDGDLSGLRWIEAPSCYVFHVMNAFDEDGAVVIDVVKHPRMFDAERRGPSEGDPQLVRWRIDLASGGLSETILEARGCEFPRFNAAFGGRAYRFGYTVAAPGMRAFGALHKHDVTCGQTWTHDFGPGRAAAEPVFAPWPGAVAEDDGWVLTFVYDKARDASDVVILDARDFEGEPVATIALPVRVPFGFHGDWLPDAAPN